MKHLKKYKFDEWLVIIFALSLFLPNYYLTYAMISVLSSIAILRKKSREKIFSCPVYKYALAVLPIFTFPALMSQNWLGLIQGLCFWYGLTFVCDMFSVMTSEFYNKIIDLLIVFSVLSVVYAVIETYYFGISRPSATFVNPNYYASAIEVFICAAFYRYSKTKKKVYWLVILANVFGLILTNCRSAWLALVVTVVFYTIYYVKKAVSTIGIMAFTAGALVFMFAFMPRMDIGHLSYSSNVRLNIWKIAWDLITRNPLIGYGSMFFMKIYEEMSLGFTPHAHNIIFNTILDFGFIGLIAFLILFGRYYRILIRNSAYSIEYDRIMKLIITLSVCFLTHGVTDAILTFAHMYILTFIMLSGVFVERNERWNKRLPSRCPA